MQTMKSKCSPKASDRRQDIKEELESGRYLNILADWTKAMMQYYFVSDWMEILSNERTVQEHINKTFVFCIELSKN